MLCGGTLEAVLGYEGRLSESSLRTVARRVLLGLRNMATTARLHHYDVKPNNIGLLRAGDYSSTVLFDFGSALPLGAMQLAHAVFGTIRLLSPWAGGTQLRCIV